MAAAGRRQRPDVLPGQTAISWRDTHRLIPSRYPPIGPFDRVASASDLHALFELEGWTNDRVSTELGVLTILPEEEWVTGPMASVVMAAFCHPRAGGGRFSSQTRGAWYAARSLRTALAESIYHRTRELAEIGGFDTRVEMRLYLADLRGAFHDLRPPNPAFTPLFDPDSYEASQKMGEHLLAEGSNGIVFRSVRDPRGQCVACFRPGLVQRVRIAGHFEYRWEGTPEPIVRPLTAASLSGAQT
jgi:hypothetical protein